MQVGTGLALSISSEALQLTHEDSAMCMVCLTNAHLAVAYGLHRWGNGLHTWGIANGMPHGDALMPFVT